MTTTTVATLAAKVSDEAADPADAPADTRFTMPGRLLVSLGLVGMLTATAALAWPKAPAGPATARRAEAPVVVADVNASDVGVVRMSYEPGQSSGWHSHPGVHAVAVVSGTLTVYGAECTPRNIGPGESYVGGQELHLTRNESAVPVEMVVTSVDTNRLTNSVRPHLAPHRCEVA